MAKINYISNAFTGTRVVVNADPERDAEEERISVEADSVSRNRIVSETDKNFFVEAGAGSGKTTMLVSRMVAMVESGIDISKICAITFTKAAAGEFYDRFQKVLIERSNPDYVWVDKGYAGQLGAPTEETRERCAEALQNIDLCFMGTIDSFCGMVLSEHPSDAGIPSDAVLMTENDAKALYKQIYVQISEGKHGAHLQDLARIFRMVFWNAEEVFTAGEALLMNNRNVNFNFTPGAVIDIDTEFAAERAEIIRAVTCLQDHRELAYTGNDASRKAWSAIDDNAYALRSRWSSNFSNVVYALRSMAGIRALPEGLRNYSASLAGVFEPGGKKGTWIEFKPGKAGGVLDKLCRMQYQLSMTFLKESVPVIEKIMKEKGAMTFFDYLFYLRNMLKADAEDSGRLIHYIYDRHSYFLIDEFQDTNPMQAEVFFYLAAQNPQPQWSACIPKPGSLFIVGDPKQSIYRFRSADVTSFLKVKGLFENGAGEILQLSRNFRSTKKLCEYFNSVFSAMLPTQTEVQSRFERIPLPEQESDEFQGIYSYNAYSGMALENHPGESDPEQIRKIVESIVGRPDIKVSRDGEEPHPVRYSDIMIITYGKAKIGPIMEELESADIPMHVEGMVPFDRNEALSAIAVIYRAVANPDDQRALYIALKDVFICLSDEELMSFRTAGGKISLLAKNNLAEDCPDAACNMDAARKVAGELSKLSELYRKALKLSPAALFAEIMDGFEVYRIAPADNIEVLYFTLELLRNAEKTGIVVSLSDGADYLENLIRGDDTVERCLNLNDTRDCVHIANLHKVKGLEAPIVILSSSQAFATGVSKRIVHGDNGSEGYIFALESERVDGKSKTYLSTTEFPDEKEAETEALDAEHDRLVYVAATRARNALILCNSIAMQFGREGAKSIWSQLLKGMDGSIFDRLENAAAEDAGGEITESASAERGEGVSADVAGDAPSDVAGDAPSVVAGDAPSVVAAAGSLYDKAKEECVLNERGNEEPTYVVENPSHAKMPSKLADDEDMIFVPAGESSVADLEMGGAEGADVEGADLSAEGGDSSAEGGADVDASKTANGGKAHASSDAHLVPALLGTMTHRLMEVMVASRDTADVNQVIKEIVSEYNTAKNKAYILILEKALKGVAQMMRNGGYIQSNDAPQDILRTLLDADEVHCEVPFSYNEEVDGRTVIWNGVMDVVYCKDGKWHIIDYKTNIDGSDLDRKYRAQLEAYKKAFKATTGEDADAKTYHIDV